MGFDFAKALAVFLVVFVHFAFYTLSFPCTKLSNALTSLCVLCVPLFFAVNGALLLNRPFNLNKHVHRLGKLVLMTILWRLISICFFTLIGAIEHPAIKEIILACFGNAPSEWPIGHFWFLDALIATYLFVPLFASACKLDEKPALLFMGILLIISTREYINQLALLFQGALGSTWRGWSTLNASFDKYLPLGQYGFLIIYFMGGALVYDKTKQLPNLPIEEKSKLIHSAVLALVVSVALIVSLQLGQHIYLGVNYGVNNGYMILPTFVFTMAVLFLALVVLPTNTATSTISEFIGSNSFGVYMLHMPLIWLFRMLQERFSILRFTEWMPNTLSLALNIVCVALVVVACSALTSCLKKTRIGKFLFFA